MSCQTKLWCRTRTTSNKGSTSSLRNLGASDGEGGRTERARDVALDSNTRLDGRGGDEREGGQDGGDGEDAGEKHCCEER